VNDVTFSLKRSSLIMVSVKLVSSIEQVLHQQLLA